MLIIQKKRGTLLMFDPIKVEEISVDSAFGQKIGFTSDKFEPISYIVKKGQDLVFSAIFEKLSKSKKEKIVKKLLNADFKFSLPMTNVITLLADITRSGYNCVFPEFCYYDRTLKSLGFNKKFVYDKIYGGYIVIWIKGTPALEINPLVLKSDKKASVNKNKQTLAFLASHLGLKFLFSHVDWVLCKFNIINAFDLQILETLGIPEYLIRIRLTYLLKNNIIKKNNRLKTFTFVNTKETEKFKQSILINFKAPSEYSRVQFNSIFSNFHYYIQNKITNNGDDKDEFKP